MRGALRQSGRQGRPPGVTGRCWLRPQRLASCRGGPGRARRLLRRRAIRLRRLRRAARHPGHAGLAERRPVLGVPRPGVVPPGEARTQDRPRGCANGAWSFTNAGPGRCRPARCWTGTWGGPDPAGPEWKLREPSLRPPAVPDWDAEPPSFGCSPTPCRTSTTPANAADRKSAVPGRSGSSGQPSNTAVVGR